MSAPVAVIVVSWNTRELLRACLASWEAEVQAGRATVWVVDNASHDGSGELVRSVFPWVQLLEPGANLGFGQAANLAAGRSSSPWLVVANADTELCPGALERLLSTGAQHPAAGIVAPRLIDPSGATQHSVHPFPTLGLTLAFNLGLTRWSRNRLTLEGGWDPSAGRAVDWALGAFVLVRRAAWDAVGGFSAEQWMYAEDLDLGWRAAEAGWSTWFEPAAVVRHVGGASTAQLWGERQTERWLQSTYGWMLRRRGIQITRAYALIGMLGAAARMALQTPGAVVDPARRSRWAEMRQWYRMHRRALFSTAERLAAQR